MPPVCLQASLGPPPPRDDRDTPGLLAAHPGSTTGSTALGPYAESAASHASGNKGSPLALSFWLASFWGSRLGCQRTGGRGGIVCPLLLVRAFGSPVALRLQRRRWGIPVGSHRQYTRFLLLVSLTESPGPLRVQTEGAPFAVRHDQL